MSEFTIDFTSKDYTNLVAQADAFASSILPEWKSRDDSDLNWATIKTVAYLVSIGMFYIDLGVNEQDPYEVQIYKNALKLARRYGMPVRKDVGAYVDIQAMISAQTITTVLPRGSTIFSSVANQYVLVNDVTFSVGATVATVSLQYGNWERYRLGTSDGTAFQKFIVERDFAQDKKIRLFIDETGVGDDFEEWEIRDSLIMSYETDKHCRLTLDEDENYNIHFGDDHSGKIPINNSLLDVEVFTLPAGFETFNYGNIAPYNIITCSAGIIGSVVQASAATGGGAKETVLDIGRALPQWISTADRCVAQNDYIYIAKRVAGVAEAKVTVDGLLVYVYVTPLGGGVASGALLQAVSDYLTPRKFDQVTLAVGTPELIAVDAIVSIYIEDTKVRAEVRSLASEALVASINSEENFGGEVTIMDMYTTLGEVEGIKRAQLLYLYKDGLAQTLGDVVLAANQQAIASLVSVIATGGIV